VSRVPQGHAFWRLYVREHQKWARVVEGRESGAEWRRPWIDPTRALQREPDPFRIELGDHTSSPAHSESGIGITRRGWRGRSCFCALRIPPVPFTPGRIDNHSPPSTAAMVLPVGGGGRPGWAQRPKVRVQKFVSLAFSIGHGEKYPLLLLLLPPPVGLVVKCINL